MSISPTHPGERRAGQSEREEEGEDTEERRRNRHESINGRTVAQEKERLMMDDLWAFRQLECRPTLPHGPEIDTPAL